MACAAPGCKSCPSTAFWEVGGITQSIPQNSCGHVAIRYGTAGGHHHCPLCQTLLPVCWHKAGTTLGPSRRCHKEQAGKRPSQLPWSLGLLPDHQLPVPLNWARCSELCWPSRRLAPYNVGFCRVFGHGGLWDELLRRPHLLPEPLWGGGDEPRTGELVTFVSPSCSAPTEREISVSQGWVRKPDERQISSAVFHFIPQMCPVRLLVDSWASSPAHLLSLSPVLPGIRAGQVLAK